MSNSTDKETKEQEKPFDFISEERLHEILSILLPWGYSHPKPKEYTGVSPYIGDRTNIITIVANDPAWGSMPLSIIMEAFDEESNEDDSLGFYKGIMKVIAPELHSTDDKFKSNFNLLEFGWASDMVQENKFPVKVTYEKPEL
jgi:hypothetical protein